MTSFTRFGLPHPRECPGMIAVLASILGAAGSVWVILAYEAIWGFTLLALFAVMGWVSFIWCAVWAQSPPDERTGAGLIGTVAGAIGLGVGLVFVIIFDGPAWSYAITTLSFLVLAVSLLDWARTG